MHMEMLVKNNVSERTGWLKEMEEAEKQALWKFFGKEFDLSPFVKTLKKYGSRNLKKWRKINLEPHFFPKMPMTSDDYYQGWDIKLDQWYYKLLSDGLIVRDIGGDLQKGIAAEFGGITALIDIRKKPEYDDGKQMWENDRFLGSIIAQFRKEGKIVRHKNIPLHSRFGISADEWESFIRPKIAERLEFGLNQVRLELACEANAIPQLFSHLPRKGDAESKTQIWFEEYYVSRERRLVGGFSDFDPLSSVGYGNSRDQQDDISFRPLIVL